jgi:hypothetical protein
VGQADYWGAEHGEALQPDVHVARRSPTVVLIEIGTGRKLPGQHAGGSGTSVGSAVREYRREARNAAT